MLDRDEAKQLADRLLAMSKADGVTVDLGGGTDSHLRFARNTPSTSGTSSNVSVSITSRFGKRAGTATVNQLDEASLTGAVRRSEEIARLAPEDPERMEELEPQQHLAIDAWDAATAEGGAGAMAKGVKRCVDGALTASAVAAGFTETSARMSCIANSKGLFGYHRRTSAGVSMTVRTEDATGSGWATDAAHRMSELSYDQVATIAVKKAVASARPRALAPGKYPTILEPACVAEMADSLIFALGARSADEGRSYFSRDGGNRLGEKLFPTEITIQSDPKDPRVPSSPWGEDGLPQEARMWIDRGKIANLSYGRFWAQKQGKTPVPSPGNVIMAGGSGSLDDLIASTERGVLVTSFWYIRSLDPRTLTLTGLTRDGVFWIENGKIAYPVNNFRWNDGPISVLKNVEAMSAAVRTPARGGSSPRIVPALRVSSFNFASVSDAV